MTHDTFWKIVADSRNTLTPRQRDGNHKRQANRLEQLLAAMTVDEVQSFDRVFMQFYFDAYRWDLWAAAYIIMGGCSDDVFMDFRRWLVSMGREVYEAAVAVPESLADVAAGPAVEDCAFEEFGYVAGRVLEGKGATAERSGLRRPGEPTGRRWKDGDLPMRFPKLWAKFTKADA